MVDVGEMHKIVNNVFGHMSLQRLLITLPGGVDEGDDKVLVQEVTQVRPIRLRTDNPSEFRNSLAEIKILLV